MVRGHCRTERGSAGSGDSIWDDEDALRILELTLGSGATALGSVSNASSEIRTDQLPTLPRRGADLITLQEDLNVTIDQRCPNCGDQTLRTWEDLSDDERDVVRRLPASADYASSERRIKHRWCTRCWHEETSNPEHTV